MLPVIFSVGPITLYSFGLVLFVTFFAFSFVVWKLGRELHFDEKELFDTVFVILFWFLVGARAGYVWWRLDDYGLDVWSWINVIGRPGLMYATGLISGGIAAWYKARMNKWDVYSFGDVLSVALALSLSMMALGMFLNGSGAGIQTDSVIGVQFTGMLEKRLPVQLLEMVLYGALFGLLWWLESRYRTFSWYKGKKSQANSGFLLGTFLSLHGLIGLVVTFLKPASMQVYGFRLDWLFFLLVALLGVWIVVSRSDMKIGERVRG